MQYRQEIDGLRALAVLSVILFHADFSFFSGGFIGVDIFFVISGYLITTLIIDELESDNFSLIQFYERRARRILPALFFVMMLCIPFAWALLPPYELKSFSKSLIATSLFASNFFFWKDGGYFETTSELKPLLHTWSLAVEEQYYLFFPPFLILFWKFRKHWLISTILIVSVLSLVAAQILSTYKPVFNFFLLPTRIWELAIGTIIGIQLNHKHRISYPTTYRQLLSIVGFIAILVSAISFSKETPYPSLYTLVPTAGAALILVFADRNTFIGSFLAFRPLVFIGLMSYSLYLWHQPILAFAKYYLIVLGFDLTALALVGIFFISYSTWKYVETPFRKSQLFSRNIIFNLSFFASIFFIVFGYYSNKIFTSSSEFSAEAKMASALSFSDAIYSSNIDEGQFIKFRIEFEKFNPHTIAIGSSRMMQVGDHNYPDKILNLSLSGLSIEELITISSLGTKKFKPDTLLLSADPWLFNSKSGQSPRESLRYDYLNLVSHKNIASSQQMAKQDTPKLPSITSIGALIYDKINVQQYVANNDAPDFRDKIRRDGSRVYNINYANKSENEIKAGFNTSLNYLMTDYAYSAELENLFTKFISSYKKNHRIILVLSPYHPNVYERIQKDRPIFRQIESSFRILAKTHNVEIIGSYNPSNVGCNKSEFYDGMHPKDSCMQKVINEILRN